MSFNSEFSQKNLIFCRLDSLFLMEFAKRSLRIESPIACDELINLRAEIKDCYRFGLSMHWPEDADEYRNFMIEESVSVAVDAIFDKVQGVKFLSERKWNKYEKVVLNSILFEYKDKIKEKIYSVRQLHGFRLADFLSKNNLFKLYHWWSWMRKSEFRTKNGDLCQSRITGLDNMYGGIKIECLMMPGKVPFVLRDTIFQSGNLNVSMIDDCLGKSILAEEWYGDGGVRPILVSENDELETNQHEIHKRLSYLAHRQLINKESDVENILRGVICWDIKNVYNKGKNVRVDDALDKGLKFITKMKKTEPIDLDGLRKNYQKTTKIVNEYNSAELPWFKSAQ